MSPFLLYQNFAEMSSGDENLAKEDFRQGSRGLCPSGNDGERQFFSAFSVAVALCFFFILPQLKKP